MSRLRAEHFGGRVVFNDNEWSKRHARVPKLRWSEGT